jgi:SAM-dependent methyltransferase
MPARRLNIGCGRFPGSGWLNLDRKWRPAVDVVADLRRGLPFVDSTFACAAAIHVMQDIPHPEIVPVLREIARILQRGGVLRLALPDLDKAIDAYLRRDTGYFLVPDDQWRSPGAKLVTQIVWFGESRTPFTVEFAEEALSKAGFRSIERCSFGITRSGDPLLAALDNREHESLFLEAAR